jgi:hypothetical protein
MTAKEKEHDNRIREMLKRAKKRALKDYPETE